MWRFDSKKNQLAFIMGRVLFLNSGSPHANTRNEFMIETTRGKNFIAENVSPFLVSTTRSQVFLTRYRYRRICISWTSTNSSLLLPVGALLGLLKLDTTLSTSSVQNSTNSNLERTERPLLQARPLYCNRSMRFRMTEPNHFRKTAATFGHSFHFTLHTRGIPRASRKFGPRSHYFHLSFSW